MKFPSSTINRAIDQGLTVARHFGIALSPRARWSPAQCTEVASITSGKQEVRPFSNKSDVPEQLSRRRFMSAYFSACTLAASLVFAHAAFADTYYVSKDGRDSNDGTSLDAPFQTIQKAASVMVAGDTCLIRKGVYRETVTTTNNGTLSAPIKFEAYNGEPVVVSGADKLDLSWSVHTGSIYKATTSVGFRQLFVDGVMLNEARWPNARVDRLLDAPRSLVAKTANATDSDVNRYLYDPKLPDGNLTGAKLHVTPGKVGGEWSAFTCPISSFDNITKKLSLAYNFFRGNENYRLRIGNPYWIYGVLALLDIPTEWHLDSSTSTLYLWAPDGASPATHQVEVKVRTSAFNLDSRSYVNVKGLFIFAAGISMRDSTGCVVDDCHLRYIQHATTANWDQDYIVPACHVTGTRNIWKNSSILFSSQNGIQLEGTYNTVQNCVIRDVAYYPGLYYASVKSIDGSNQTITGNTLARSGRALILPYADPMEISYNDVGYGQMLTKDGGAIYVWGESGYGVKIHHNWVHHDQRGIYLDSGASGFQVYRNVCFENEYGIKFNGPGYDHKVYNNTLLRNSIWSIARTDGPTVSLWRTQIVNTLRDNDFGTQPADATIDKQGWYPPLAANFVPQPGSGAIDTGAVVPGYTDGFVGAGPDIGAYEAGGTYWVPGADFSLPAFPTPESTAPPTAPTQLQLSPRNATQEALLTWVPPSSPVSFYTVKRADSPGGPFAVVGTVNSGQDYTDTGLNPEAAYFYMVTATNSSGESGNSNQAISLANQEQIEVVLNESFETGDAGGQYTNGVQLRGQNVVGGTIVGFSSANNTTWTSNTALPIVTTGGVTSSPVNGAGGAVDFRGSTDAIDRYVTRAINSYTPSASLHFSGTLSATTLDTDAVSFITFTQAMSNYGACVLNGNTFDGVAFGFKGNGTGMDLVIRYRGTAGSYVDTVLVNNVAPYQTYTVSGQINWNVSGINDSLLVKVNGTSFGPTLTGQLGTGSNINTVGLAQRNFGIITGDKVTMDDLRLARSAPWSALQVWRVSQGLVKNGSGSSANTADPDGDGSPNLIEYALGARPIDAASAPNPIITMAPSTSTLNLTFLRACPATELTYTVQASSDLVTWTNLAVNPGTVGGNVTVSDIPTAGSTRRFLRLKVSTP